MDSRYSDQQIITHFISNSENTMNEVITSSVGSALVRLSEQYWAAETPEKKCENTRRAIEQCHSDLNALKQSTKDTSLATAISDVLNICQQPKNQLDMFSLYSFNEGDTEWDFSLIEVLSLVWQALNDNNEFPDHADSDDRLETFFNCIKNISKNPVCHQGVRNELVFTLNKVYPGIDIIEDKAATIIAFLNENISELFIHDYYDLKDDKKTHLLPLLLSWVKGKNPQSILALLDPDKKIINDLTALFLMHGVNPAHVLSDIHSAFPHIKFVCDPKKYPELYCFSKLSSLDCILKQGVESAALEAFQMWVANLKMISESTINIINDFILLFETYQNVLNHSYILKITDRFTDQDIEVAMTEMAHSFEKFIQCRNERLTPDFREKLIVYNKQIMDAKQEAWLPQINGFFEFELHDVYHLLMNDTFISKVMLSDLELHRLIKSHQHLDNTGRETLVLTPYLVNKVLICGIVQNPELDWTPAFSDFFKRILTSIDSPRNKLSFEHPLKLDSYKSFIKQFHYLYAQYRLKDDSSIILPRPEVMLLHPKDIKTWVDYALFAINVHDRDKLKFVYQMLKVRINQLLMDKLTTEPDLNGLFLLPPDEVGNFLNHLGNQTLNDLIVKFGYTIEDFYSPFILSILPRVARENLELDEESLLSLASFAAEESISYVMILDAIGADKIIDMIVEPSLLIEILEFLSEHDIFPFLTWLGSDKLNDLIKGIEDVWDILTHLLPDEQILFINILSKSLLEQIVNSYSDFNSILDIINPEHRINFLTCLDTIHLTRIINSVGKLVNTLKKVDDVTLITTLGQKHIDELVDTTPHFQAILKVLSPPGQRVFLDYIGSEKVKQLISGFRWNTVSHPVIADYLSQCNSKTSAAPLLQSPTEEFLSWQFRTRHGTKRKLEDSEKTEEPLLKKRKLR